MASRRRKTTQPADGEAPVAESREPAPGVPKWREPPEETREAVRRHQQAIARVSVPRGHPLAPAIARGVELWQSLTLRHWVVLVAVLGAVVGLSQLLSLGEFTVTAHNVLVRGNRRASTDEIYAASELEGRNIFRVAPEDAAARVSEVPGIKSAEIHLRLPAQVIIDVQEFLPLAIVQTVTETLWIGTNGSTIQQAGDPPGLVLVEDNGSVRDDHGTVLPEIVEGLEAIQSRRPDMTEIHYGTLEGLYLRAPEGYTVYLGEGGGMGRKLALLEATEQQILDRGLHPTAIDLRFDGYAMLK